MTDLGSRGQSDVSNIWYTTDDVGGVQNRLTDYDNKQPVPVGWDPRGWAATGNGDRKSWVFKRNYTFDIVDDASDGTGLWDATGKKLLDTSATIRNPNGYGSVLCAVNIFGQDDYYKYPRDASNRQWNALCYKLPISTRMFPISVSPDWPMSFPLITIFFHLRASMARAVLVLPMLCGLRPRPQCKAF